MYEIRIKKSAKKDLDALDGKTYQNRSKHSETEK